MYFVRWYAPGRAGPLRRIFHTKPKAAAFRAGLPYLSEPPQWERQPAPERGAPRPQITWAPSK